MIENNVNGPIWQGTPSQGARQDFVQHNLQEALEQLNLSRQDSDFYVIALKVRIVLDKWIQEKAYENTLLKIFDDYQSDPLTGQQESQNYKKVESLRIVLKHWSFKEQQMMIQTLIEYFNNNKWTSPWVKKNNIYHDSYYQVRQDVESDTMYLIERAVLMLTYRRESSGFLVDITFSLCFGKDDAMDNERYFIDDNFRENRFLTYEEYDFLTTFIHPNRLADHPDTIINEIFGKGSITFNPSSIEPFELLSQAIRLGSLALTKHSLSLLNNKLDIDQWQSMCLQALGSFDSINILKRLSTVKINAYTKGLEKFYISEIEETMKGIDTSPSNVQMTLEVKTLLRERMIAAADKRFITSMQRLHTEVIENIYKLFIHLISCEVMVWANQSNNNTWIMFAKSGVWIELLEIFESIFVPGKRTSEQLCFFAPRYLRSIAVLAVYYTLTRVLGATSYENEVPLDCKWLQSLITARMVQTGLAQTSLFSNVYREGSQQKNLAQTSLFNDVCREGSHLNMMRGFFQNVESNKYLSHLSY